MSDESEVNAKGEESISLPNDFSAMIDKVLSNPEILTTVASALSGSSVNGAGEENAKTAEKEKVEDSVQAASALDTDAMMQRLPQMMKLLSPMLSGGGAKSQGSSAAPSDKRTCLLLAIKPYLSPERCEAIDYIVKFSKLSEILKTIN